MANVPTWLNVLFILIVGITYSLIILGARYANNITRAVVPMGVVVFRLIVGGWVLMTGLLAIQGVFLDFQSVPPKIVAAAFTCAVGLAAFAFSPLMSRWLTAISQTSIIALQSFRFFVEVVLFLLAQTPLLPKLMSFEGRNFDVLVGVTAPLMALWIHREGNTPRVRRAIVAWNLIGIVLLVNVVAHGILSAPTPMQKIFVEPPNTAIGYFPFAWLPAFLVPVALFLHILSLRKVKMGSAGDRK